MLSKRIRQNNLQINGVHLEFFYLWTMDLQLLVVVPVFHQWSLNITNKESRKDKTDSYTCPPSNPIKLKTVRGDKTLLQLSFIRIGPKFF